MNPDQALLDVVLAQRNSALNEAAKQTARANVAEAKIAEMTQAKDVSDEAPPASST
jgi:hypothetical protein